MSVEPHLSNVGLVFFVLSLASAIYLGVFCRQKPLRNAACVLAIMSLAPLPVVREAYRWRGVPIAYLPLYVGILLSCARPVVIRKSIARGLSDIGLLLPMLLLTGVVVSQVLWVESASDWLTYAAQFLGFVFVAWLFIPSIYPSKDSVTVDLSDAASLAGLMGYLGAIRYLFMGYPDANVLVYLDRNCSVLILAVLLPTAVQKAMTLRTKTSIILLVGNFVGMLFSYSRGAWIASAISIVMVIAFYPRSVRLIRLVPHVILVAAVLGIVWWLRPQSATLVMARLSFSNSDVRRMLLMEEGIRIAQQRILIGTGLGLKNYLEYFLAPVKVAARPHNVVISYTAQLGLVGIVPLSALLMPVLLRLPKSFRKAKTVALPTALAILVSLLFNEYLTYPFLWLAFGAAMRLAEMVLYDQKNIALGPA